MKRKKISAISLIEVLIAIYIFGIGILVILRMLISNISWLYDLRAKDTAVSLGKEAIDIVFHLRDSNIEKGMTWDCLSVVYTGTPGNWICESNFLTSGLNRYRLNRSLTGLYELETIVSTGDAVLRYHTGIIYSQLGQSYTGFWYNHDETSGEETYFVRRIEIFPQTNYPAMTGQVLGVRSIVEYQRGGRTNLVVLESILGDMR